MESKNTKFKKTILGVALVAALGTTASVSAAVTTFTFDGLFTMVGANGGVGFQNTSNPYYADPTWGYGLRTQVSGTLSLDSVTGSGSMTMSPFAWGSSGPWQTYSMTLQAIGNGLGQSGPLILGNMLFNWNGNSGVPVSIVWDASGLFGAMGSPGFGVGTVISGVGALPASNGIKSGVVPIGATPVATTTWNTTTCTGTTIGTAVSGCLPLIADNVAGSPMIIGPWATNSVNLDITRLTVTAVPLPAAVWLLGSGLLGLIGFSRRRKGV